MMRKLMFRLGMWVAGRAVGHGRLEDFIGEPVHPSRARQIEIDASGDGIMVWMWPVGWVNMKVNMKWGRR